MQTLSSNRSFDGWHQRFEHRSNTLDCTMSFAAYLPPQAEHEKVPVLWWLSGLTCTDENFMQKAGAHRLASQLGLAIVCPDTSPRGTKLPGEHEDYDLGAGAGFYLNASQAPWNSHYRMFDYVTEELPTLVRQHLPIGSDQSICGHSMGGHGALICALKGPETTTQYRPSHRSATLQDATGGERPSPPISAKTAMHGKPGMRAN